MSANVEFPEEMPGDIPVASAANKKRLFLDQTDGLFKTKDDAGTVEAIATLAIAWIHNANVQVGDSPYAATIQETVKVDADTGAIQVDLPTAIGSAGRQVKVVSLSDAVTPPVVTIATTGGQTINGDPTRTLTTPRQRVTVESDGSNWLVV